MTIKTASAKRVQPSREHDRLIVDEFRAPGPRNNRQLLDLNAARARPQVTTAPDAADAQGKKITKEVLEGVKPPDRRSKMKRPRQPVTTAKQRSLRKAALGAAFAPSGRALTKSLGKWAGPPTQAWRSFHGPRASRVVTSATGPVTRFAARVARSRTRRHVDATPSATMLRHASLDDADWSVMVPAAAQKTAAGNVTATLRERVEEPQSEEGEAHTFREHAKKLPEHERRLLWHFELTPGGERALKSCLQRNATLKAGNRRIFPSGERNGLFRVGIDWQPDIAGARSRASRWGAIDDELHKSRTTWSCVAERVPASLREASPD